MKKISLLILTMLILGGCAGLSKKSETIPPPPSQEAIWVYGHYDPQGRWIPGRWLE